MCPTAYGTINTPPVGATLAVARLPCTTLHGNPVIAKPVRTLAVAIRIPRPQALLPKGGWHGEAVTGGFFPRTSRKTLSLRSQCVHWLWQSAPPSPLPKGGWHGEAVTGGFFFRTPCSASVGGGGCPPSCQPILGHCCGRQSGHFLEIGSLLPPLAALRRFPRRPVLPHLL